MPEYLTCCRKDYTIPWFMFTPTPFFFVARGFILLCSRCRNIQCCYVQSLSKTESSISPHVLPHATFCLRAKLPSRQCCYCRFFLFSLLHTVRWGCWFVCGRARYVAGLTGYELEILGSILSRNWLFCPPSRTKRLWGPRNFRVSYEAKTFPRRKPTVTWI
jgi:hypothetical protein